MKPSFVLPIRQSLLGPIPLFLLLLCLSETPRAAVIYDSWNADMVNNNPSILPVFTVTTESKVTEISNYHWNGGAGLDPVSVGATISIYDHVTNVLIGSWAAAAQLPSTTTYWVVYPDVVLQPGNYRVEDSSRTTWSAGRSDFFGYLGQTGPNWGIGVGFSRVSATAVPEPSSIALLGSVVVLVVARHRRASDNSASAPH